MDKKMYKEIIKRLDEIEKKLDEILLRLPYYYTAAELGTADSGEWDYTAPPPYPGDSTAKEYGDEPDP